MANDAADMLAVPSDKLPPAVTRDATTARAGLGRIARQLYIGDILVGLAAAAAAVAVRAALPLPPDVLPTFTLVIAVSVVTVFVGLVAGVTTMIAAGLIAWRTLFTANWWLSGEAAVVFSGYFAVTIVILITSQLYRVSQQRLRDAEVLRAHQEAERALQDAERADLFAREMAHRLKNALAIVQAIASQTFDRESPEVAKFTGRLRALSNAHNLLSEHVEVPKACVSEVVGTALEPFGDWSSRFRLSGPKVEIRDTEAVSLALALHELGTNAVKYGALSNGHGSVDIAWTRDGSGFELRWKERDGPPVVPPRRTGFGAKLLGRQAMRSELAYDPDGVRCTIRSR